MGFLPQHLLAAPGLLVADNPQHLANAAWACGQLGHRDEQLMAALLTEAQLELAASRQDGSSKGGRNLTTQELCNLCWAVAVLDLQQHVQQVLQLAQACSSQWHSVAPEELKQLWQVHTWLLDFQLAGGQGLQGSLTEQQLQQCNAAWQQQMQDTLTQAPTQFQHSVFAAVQRLPVAWQQQPQMEQLSAGRDGVTPDGALLLDIAGRTAAGVLVAVEADGRTHFRRPDGGLTGPTQYRNKALAVGATGWSACRGMTGTTYSTIQNSSSSICCGCSRRLGCMCQRCRVMQLPLQCPAEAAPQSGTSACAADTWQHCHA
jgi:hypothetical protein